MNTTCLSARNAGAKSQQGNRESLCFFIKNADLLQRDFLPGIGVWVEETPNHPAVLDSLRPTSGAESVRPSPSRAPRPVSSAPPPAPQLRAALTAWCPDKAPQLPTNTPFSHLSPSCRPVKAREPRRVARTLWAQLASALQVPH